jgi:hypothetical protein
MNQREQKLNAIHRVAEEALYTSGPRAMIEVISSSTGEGLTEIDSIDADEEKFQKDYEIAEIVYQAKGPVAAIKALAHLRGWGKKE